MKKKVCDGGQAAPAHTDMPLKHMLSLSLSYSLYTLFAISYCICGNYGISVLNQVWQVLPLKPLLHLLSPVTASSVWRLIINTSTQSSCCMDVSVSWSTVRTGLKPPFSWKKPVYLFSPRNTALHNLEKKISLHVSSLHDLMCGCRGGNVAKWHKMICLMVCC